jgi:hypothetical protein
MGVDMSTNQKVDTDSFSRDDYDRVALKAVWAIGSEKIRAMSQAQINLLNGSLDRILRRRGDVSAVTDMELIGAYEMIVDHVLPSYIEEIYSRP